MIENHKGYHKLIIWQKGKQFMKVLYLLTENYPKHEIFGLQSQIRRAVVSFLLNIVEGHKRKSTKEFLQFLNIAEASLVEVEACLEISFELSYITEREYSQLEEQRRELARIMRSFVKSLNKR